MSKWGYVSPADAQRWIDDGPSVTVNTISEMSQVILDQEKAFSDLKDTVIELQASNMAMRSSEGHLRGYIARVKETEPLARIRDILKEG